MTAIVLYGNEGSGQGGAERETVSANFPNSTKTSFCFELHASECSDWTVEQCTLQIRDISSRALKYLWCIRPSVFGKHCVERQKYLTRSWQYLLFVKYLQINSTIQRFGQRGFI